MDHSPSQFSAELPDMYDQPSFADIEAASAHAADAILPTEYAHTILEGTVEPPDIAERRKSFSATDKDCGGGFVTEEKPGRFVSGYTPQYHQPHAAGVRNIVLEQQWQPLYPGHELTVTMRENALVWLEPGDEGALATDEISGCTVVAGIAHYIDGWRSAYVSHFNPSDDFACRTGSQTWGRALSANAMRQFATNASDREGLARIAFAVVHFGGLPKMPIYSYDWPRDGQLVTNDIQDVAAELKQMHGASVVYEPYQLAVPADHAVTANMASDHSAVYFNDKRILELGL